MKCHENVNNLELQKIGKDTNYLSQVEVQNTCVSW